MGKLCGSVFRDQALFWEIVISSCKTFCSNTEDLMLLAPRFSPSDSKVSVFIFSPLSRLPHVRRQRCSHARCSSPLLRRNSRLVRPSPVPPQTERWQGRGHFILLPRVHGRLPLSLSLPQKYNWKKCHFSCLYAFARMIALYLWLLCVHTVCGCVERKLPTWQEGNFKKRLLKNPTTVKVIVWGKNSSSSAAAAAAVNTAGFKGNTAGAHSGITVIGHSLKL